MIDEKQLPLLVGSARVKLVATAFGSTDGTIESIADRFDRARAEARIRFEERNAAFERRETYIDAGSPDGSFERLTSTQREAVLARAKRTHADAHAASEAAMRRPALLRASLLNPFHSDKE